MEAGLEDTNEEGQELLQRTSLTALPEEILLLVLAEISQSTSDCFAVSLVSKQLNRIITPVLYSHTTFEFRREPRADGFVDFTKGLQALDSATNLAALAHYIQHFGLYSSEPATYKPCWSSSNFSVFPKLLKILKNIPQGQLRSFIWVIGLKCPGPIFHQLRLCQRSLDTLIVDNRGFLKMLGTPEIEESTFGFSAFPKLRNLYIRGDVQYYRQQRVLINKISTIFQNLETFLFITPGEKPIYWKFWDTDYLIRMDMKSQSSAGIAYPGMKTLVCNENNFVPLLIGKLNLTSVSQLPNLRSLCARSHLSAYLLTNFDSRVPIFLTTLDVQSCSTLILSKFLLAFQGLINLDILVASQDEYIDAAPIVHHGATLKRLALWKAGMRAAGEHDIVSARCYMVPIPAPLMLTMGDQLTRLEELCGSLSREYDPFVGNRFPRLKLLWSYNMNPDSSYPDSFPIYPWIPPTNDAILDHPQWTLKNGTLERDIRTYDVTLPKNLTALAIGHYTRVMPIHDAASNMLLNAPKYTARLYRRIGTGNNIISWKRIGMKELVRESPSLISPYEDTFEIPLLKRLHFFTATELNGVLTPSDLLPDSLDELTV